jgi:hypothetical protein
VEEGLRNAGVAAGTTVILVELSVGGPLYLTYAIAPPTVYEGVKAVPVPVPFSVSGMDQILSQYPGIAALGGKVNSTLNFGTKYALHIEFDGDNKCGEFWSEDPTQPGRRFSFKYCVDPSHGGAEAMATAMVELAVQLVRKADLLNDPAFSEFAEGARSFALWLRAFILLAIAAGKIQ